MNKTKQVQGVYFQWRKLSSYDELRVFVRPKNSEQISISPKNQPLLRQINSIVKTKSFRKEDTLNNHELIALMDRLKVILKDNYGLRDYKAQEKLNLKLNNFDFQKTIENFETFKNENTSVGRAYKNTLENFWMPFFISKCECEHPKDFFKFRREAERFVKESKNIHGELFSPKSYHALTKPLNEYLKFLVEESHLDKYDSFSINIKHTLSHQKVSTIRDSTKSNLPKEKRNKDVYSLNDIIDIKRRIDSHFEDNTELKKIAYCLYLGIITGVRRGNLLGMKENNLHPDAKIPYFEIEDNIISGWNYGESGAVTFRQSTKTSQGIIFKLPLVCPDKKTAIEVARFIKNNTESGERILNCHPDTVARYWKKICKIIGIRYLHPHAWRHSFITVASSKLNEWFKGNPRFLQEVCLHSSYRTTEKYIKKQGDEFLRAIGND